MSFNEGVPGRHALVRLRPDAAWRALNPGTRTRLERWFGSGRPAVMARLQGGEPHGHFRLGVPLPPIEGKQRLALIVRHNEVLEWRHALPLREVLVAAPSGWHEALQDLAERTRVLGLKPRVYGSFAWQALTGLAYVTSESDLDLAWQARSIAELRALFTMLEDWENEHGRRADGEVLLPDGSGVCWRELAGGTRRVLVKTTHNAFLRAREAVLETFATTGGADNDGVRALMHTG